MLAMILSVGTGGAIGAICRFLIGFWVVEKLNLSSWIAILTVNIIGCFMIGIVASYIALSGMVSDYLRGFFVIGFLGGLTTFSSFTLDGYAFLQAGKVIEGAVYIGASVMLSFIGFIFGYRLVLLMAGQG